MRVGRWRVGPLCIRRTANRRRLQRRSSPSNAAAACSCRPALAAQELEQPERFPHIRPVEVVAAADDLSVLELGDSAATPLEASTIRLLAADRRPGPGPVRVPLNDDGVPGHDDVSLPLRVRRGRRLASFAALREPPPGSAGSSSCRMLRTPTRTLERSALTTVRDRRR